jgi:hypothetical protein
LSPWKLEVPKRVKGFLFKGEILIPKAYSMDLRERVIGARDEEQTISQVGAV